jgi:hypothetical protein
LFHTPNDFRIRKHPLPKYSSDDSAGNNGCFLMLFEGYKIYCFASDKEGWEHVAVTVNRNRKPTWEVMSHVKDLFWDDNDCVVQYHPPKAGYVDSNPNTLHLWRHLGRKIWQRKVPMPSVELIGLVEKRT